MFSALRPRGIVVPILAVLLLGGCSGADTQSPASTSDPMTSDPTTLIAEPTTGVDGETNTPVPIVDPVERTWPKAIDTVSAGEREFTLFGVHRLPGDRAVVTGRIAGSTSSTAASQWFEPGFFHSSGGYEFSRVAVVGDADVRHLPVRDDDRCLCSLSTKVYEELDEVGEAPAWVVVSLPADLDTVDVEIADVGTIEDVPVTELPEKKSVPFGWNEVLTVDEIWREDGVLTVRSTLANAGDFRPSYTLARHEFGFRDREEPGCFQGLAAYGSATPTGRMVKDPDCHRGSLAEPGRQITLLVKIADPGSEDLVVLPDAGLPVTVPAQGRPAAGSPESLRDYAARTERAGASIESGRTLTVSLDTSVLFDLDEAELTDDARTAIAVAVKGLREQGARSLVVSGHTDGQGSAGHNEDLSKRRAQAVAGVLRQQLGDGWKISVDWHGSSRPVADESGNAEQVKAARERNRRVEITVR